MMNKIVPIYLDFDQIDNLMEFFDMYFFKMIHDLYSDIDNIDWAISMLDIYKQLQQKKNEATIQQEIEEAKNQTSEKIFNEEKNI